MRGVGASTGDVSWVTPNGGRAAHLPIRHEPGGSLMPQKTGPLGDDLCHAVPARGDKDVPATLGRIQLEHWEYGRCRWPWNTKAAAGESPGMGEQRQPLRFNQDHAINRHAPPVPASKKPNYVPKSLGRCGAVLPLGLFMAAEWSRSPVPRREGRTRFPDAGDSTEGCGGGNVLQRAGAWVEAPGAWKAGGELSEVRGERAGSGQRGSERRGESRSRGADLQPRGGEVGPALRLPTGPAGARGRDGGTDAAGCARMGFFEAGARPLPHSPR